MIVVLPRALQLIDSKTIVYLITHIASEMHFSKSQVVHIYDDLETDLMQLFPSSLSLNWKCG